jgi:hypothetical protein
MTSPNLPTENYGVKSHLDRSIAFAKALQIIDADILLPCFGKILNMYMSWYLFKRPWNGIGPMILVPTIPIHTSTPKLFFPESDSVSEDVHFVELNIGYSVYWTLVNRNSSEKLLDETKL